MNGQTERLSAMKVSGHVDERKPSALIEIPWLPEYHGGVNVVVLTLLKHLSRNNDFDPVLLVNDWDAREPEQSEFRGYQTVKLNLVGPQRGLKSILSFVRRMPKLLRQLQDMIKDRNVRLIDVHYPTTDALGFAILKKLGRYSGKFFLSFHGTDVLTYKSSSFLERCFQNFIISQSDRLIVCSDQLGTELRSAVPEKYREKIITIRNGVDHEAFLHDDFRQPGFLDQLEQRDYILCVAKYTPNKGLKTLITAFSRVAPAHPDLYLTLVGASTPYIDELRALVQDLDIADRVTFFEDVEHANLPSFYLNARMLVLPSFREGAPLVLLEAALCKLPVIATRVGGIPELIKHDQSGLLFPSGDDNALTEALERVLDDEAVAQRLATQLHEHVMQEMTWQSRYNKYIDVVAGQSRATG